MKTNLFKTAVYVLNTRETNCYNIVERIKIFNRTNYTAMKQFDFMQSVDYRPLIPQI